VNDVAWAKDNRTIVYVTEDDLSKRSDTLWVQTLGSPASRRYVETDELFDLSLRRTRDGEYLIVDSVAKDTSEARFVPAGEPFAEPALFAPRRDGVQYEIDEREGLFYIRTNDGAPDYAVYTTPVGSLARDEWTLFLGERAGTTINDVSLFKDFAVVSGRREGLSSLEIFDFTTSALTPLTFPEDDYAVRLGQNEEYDTAVVRVVYQSLVTPLAVYDIDVRSGQRTLVKQIEVPGFAPGRYVAERVFATASDGVKIPISIVGLASLRGSEAPLYLYGYGSYGISIDPSFSAARLPLLDRGVRFAIAHIRGGGEYGEAWRLAGNLKKKRTTFSDFIACAEFLAGAGYTSPDRLAIGGGSAGGLLVGAVLNERPDLCRAAIAEVPFVDVLTTMLDASLPLTTGEYREWGNPNIADDYFYMRSYSPYDTIAQTAYPDVLVEVSLNDSQVPYWEGAKYAAKLRAHTTSGRPVLLKTNMGAGHGGASGRYDALREAAFNWAFIASRIQQAP
jgi:oligopeptidase B